MPIFRRPFLCLSVRLVLCGLLAPSTAWAKQNQYLMTRPGQDLSAYRLDCDVFGWNRSFTEVASLHSEVHRYPKGKQRGEGFMLVHEIGRPWPIHNVVLHYITHADNPRDPLPIEDVRELMWLIEYQFEKMWPKRPMYHQPRGAMAVNVLMEPVPTHSVAAHDETPSGPQKLAPKHEVHASSAPTQSAEDSCTPHVGFVLTWHGETRIMPMLPLDMHAHCHALAMDDRRIYWGRKDIAAAMVRLDFSSHPDNEQSARFVSSASWAMAEKLRFDIAAEAPLALAARQNIVATLSPYGQVRLRDGRGEGTLEMARDGAAYPIRAHATRKWLSFAHYLGRLLGNEDIALVEIEGADDERILSFEYVPGTPPPLKPARDEAPGETPAAAGTSPADEAAPHRPLHHSPVFGADVPGDAPEAAPIAPAEPDAAQSAPPSSNPAAPAQPQGQYLDP